MGDERNQDRDQETTLMTTRLGLGPVFTYEWLTSARRWQVYAGRSLFVTIVLTALTVVWATHVAQQPIQTFGDLARVGRSFFEAIVSTQLVLVLLAAPAATAGSICQDRTRGTLTHVLVTDLSNAEIVLGKLASRLISVVGYVACTLPVMALAVLLGGVDPLALAGALLVTLAVALLGSTLAQTLSVWATKVHEVLLATYLIWAVWLLARPVWENQLGGSGWTALAWLEAFDPLWLALSPSIRPGPVNLVGYLPFLCASLLASCALATLAVVRIRTVAARLTGRGRTSLGPARAASRLRPQIPWWPGPSLDGNPVLWREWHRNRPTRWARVLGIIFALLASAFTILAIIQSMIWNNRADLAPWVNGLQAGVGLLLAAVVAATTLSEERARGSLDVLLATPLSTPAIVWGKWWGAFRVVPGLAVLPGILGYALALQRENRWAGPTLIVGLILSYGAALASLGLALSTWIPRLGRVLALTIAVHVLITVGWLFLVLTLFDRGNLGRELAEASPFFGTGMLTAAMETEPDVPWRHYASWAMGWIAFYTTVAVLLFLATLATFDRCLGRISDRPHASRPRSKPQRVQAPVMSST